MHLAERLLIGGRWVPAADGGEFKTLDPATGETLAVCAEADESDVDAAVAAARTALHDPAWRDMPPVERGRLLWKIADLIESHGDELARLETRDQGQPIGLARTLSVAVAAAVFRYHAGWCTRTEGSTAPVSVPNVLHCARREPVGVCALITPWNFPLMIAAEKLAPALAAGNTVILKPAEQTPLTTVFLARLCAQAGVPDGVVNCLTGGAATGRALAEHPHVHEVSFTGSTETGKAIVHASAGNLKRVSLEIGGKAPSVIAKDADIDAAVAGNLQACLLNSGQVRAAHTRFYVDSTRVGEFTEKIAAAVSSLPIGPGLDRGTVIGPLVSAERLDYVGRHVALAVDQGACLVTGGQRLDGPGNFFQPTVFCDVTDQMTVARTDILGPVLSVLSYEDPDELAVCARDADHVPAACVWTRDMSFAHRIAASIRARSVYVNLVPFPDPASPWGGFGTIGEFTATKNVWVGLS
jgi:aldehyde dehydrogenase (NAD+)/betaine-aldehyde dehydrogenase